MNGDKGGYMCLVGKPEGNKPLGRPKHGWVDLQQLYVI
jgi:hypothetical protein